MTGAKPSIGLNAKEDYDLANRQTELLDKNGDRFYVINEEDEELAKLIVWSNMIETSFVLAGVIKYVHRFTDGWARAYESSK